VHVQLIEIQVPSVAHPEVSTNGHLQAVGPPPCSHQVKIQLLISVVAAADSVPHYSVVTTGSAALATVTAAVVRSAATALLLLLLL
jgi:hypothetical protein